MRYMISMPRKARQKSSVLFFEGGIRYNYDLNQTTTQFLEPVHEMNGILGPKVVPLWHGQHAPGNNILAWHYKAQGREAVQAYMSNVESTMTRLGLKDDVLDGNYRIVPFYNMTEDGELSGSNCFLVERCG